MQLNFLENVQAKIINMGFKFWKCAKVVKGNKKNFESNELTFALAQKWAKHDAKKEKKSKKQKV